MGATSGVGTAHPSGAPEFTTGFSWVRVTQSLVLSVMFCRSLFVLLYLFLFAMLLSVLLRFTDSDYHSGIFKLLSKLSLFTFVHFPLKENSYYNSVFELRIVYSS
jgi:hypothetical protein